MSVTPRAPGEPWLGFRLNVPTLSYQRAVITDNTSGIPEPQTFANQITYRCTWERKNVLVMVLEGSEVSPQSMGAILQNAMDAANVREAARLGASVAAMAQREENLTLPECAECGHGPGQHFMGGECGVTKDINDAWGQNCQCYAYRHPLARSMDEMCRSGMVEFQRSRRCMLPTGHPGTHADFEKKWNDNPDGPNRELPMPRSVRDELAERLREQVQRLNDASDAMDRMSPPRPRRPAKPPKPREPLRQKRKLDVD